MEKGLIPVLIIYLWTAGSLHSVKLKWLQLTCLSRHLWSNLQKLRQTCQGQKTKIFFKSRAGRSEIMTHKNHQDLGIPGLFDFLLENNPCSEWQWGQSFLLLKDLELSRYVLFLLLSFLVFSLWCARRNSVSFYSQIKSYLSLCRYRPDFDWSSRPSLFKVIT